MNIDDIIENAQLKGRIIALNAQVETLTAEVRCLEAVIRSHERVDCLTVANLKVQLAKSEEHNTALCERLQDLNGEVHTASCTNARLHSQFANSEQENARFKAEVERLTFDPLTYLDDQGEWMPRHIYLAAVERLKADVNELAAGLKLASEVGIKIADEVTRLKAEVERLRKAGDWMREALEEGPIDYQCRIDRWNAAKEGKQS